MKRAGLARNLAESLANDAWTDEAIRQVLMRRLPVVLARVIPALSHALLRQLPVRSTPDASVVANALQTVAAFEVMYRFCARRGIWPDPDLTLPRLMPALPFAGLAIPRLATPGDLADWLFVPLAQLDYLADISGRHARHGDMAVNHYHYHLLPKRAGGVRLIEAPKQRLKALQRHILRGILDKVPIHADAFGFAAGRSCLQAAARHAGEEVVVGFDLRHFFASVHAGRVFGLWRGLGYPHAVARMLTGLCTTATPARVQARIASADRRIFGNAHLPQGSPASPALANLLAFSLDRRLAGLARRLDAQYSRYADDMSFSGESRIVAPLLAAVPQITCDEGLPLNPGKTRVMLQGGRQVVTGVVVNRHLNVKRADYDRLKAVIHACARPADMRLADPAFHATMQGQIGWVAAVNPSGGAKLQALFDDARAASPL